MPLQSPVYTGAAHSSKYRRMAEQNLNTGEAFSAEERELLAPYVTNTDGSVFALTNLPEVIKGALFSRYSRSTLGLRRLLLKEFIQAPEAQFAGIAGNSANADASQRSG